MATLSKELRNKLQRVTIAAREAAEAACRAALENLAVHEKDYRGHMTVEQRELRNRLRARGRALGDALDASKGTQAITRLTEDAAYEHWHRLLFTRFLADNGLLHTDEAQGNVPVTLEDCEELAPELGAKDGFDLACQFSEHILPGVFRSNDPVFEIPLARKDQVKLRELLDSLPQEVFTGDDSLGWTYQFWQEKRKDEVNKSGKRIGSQEISPVTQLFTEDYMVEFLLHNTLGAWWASKFGPIVAVTEEDAREKVALPPRDGIGVTWNYLRFVQDEGSKTWSAAAGTFEGWPKTVKRITFLDPCMGSGHFPAFALPILARLRMEEEKTSVKDAVDAVLRDNIFGLELDPRCTQIGAFNLALTAWKLGGYNPLPQLHVACCGLAPQGKLNEWLSLAGNNDKLQNGMKRLYELFNQAPVLGSLINPRQGGGDLLDAQFHDLQPLLEKAMLQETKDEASHEMAVTALGVAKAAEILASRFTLVATNVPYLGSAKQDTVLQNYCERVHPNGVADLATCFVERCLSFLEDKSSVALVTPQSWFNQPSYTALRESLLSSKIFRIVGRLGPRAFETISGERVNVCLSVISNEKPVDKTEMIAIRADEPKTPTAKALLLKTGTAVALAQVDQLNRPNSVVVFERLTNSTNLSEFAFTAQGFATSDNPPFIRMFWEFSQVPRGWVFAMSAPPCFDEFSGRSELLLWENGEGAYYQHAMALKREGRLGGWKSGSEAWGRQGVLVSEMGQMASTIYTGEMFDHTAHALIPKRPELLGPIWAYASSSEFRETIRKFSQKLNITNETLVKVPFDAVYWQNIAEEKYENGLPKPYSDDPRQWLFDGHPEGSEQPLHVAIARLLGYRWPRQTGSNFPDCPAIGVDGIESHADDDGIVALPSSNREQPAAARLRALLGAALGSFDERSLLSTAGNKGSKSKTLEDWVRDEFFDQHCELFHQRPFIWQVWDGRKDGFAALVNYHKLDHATLQKLTYSHLGTWIHDQEADAKADKPGAAERLEAAKNLQAELVKILDGEAPYDIFVRWKPIQKQAVGWNPDLNDGVRLNIRPFLTANDVGKKGAGILRSKPNIKWEKDRGTEPQRSKDDFPWFWCEEEPGTDPSGGKNFIGHRWNNVHLTLAKKQAAKK